MADDVLRLLDHLRLGAVTLLGHPLGGSVAYLLAEQHPHRVERLIVEDVPPPFPRNRPVRSGRTLSSTSSRRPSHVGELNRGNPTTRDQLSAISAPSLLIGGGPDSHIPQQKLREVAERIPDCTHITIPAGHHVHRTRPADFSNAVLDWLAGTPSS